MCFIAFSRRQGCYAAKMVQLLRGHGTTQVIEMVQQPGLVMLQCRAERHSPGLGLMIKPGGV